MRRFLSLLVLVLLLPLAARAEQKVLMFGYHRWDMVANQGAPAQIAVPRQVELLLSKGWRVVNVTSSGPGDSNAYLVIFVLESPVAAPVKP